MAFNLEDKISIDELAPSLQNLINGMTTMGAVTTYVESIQNTLQTTITQNANTAASNLSSALTTIHDNLATDVTAAYGFIPVNPKVLGTMSSQNADSVNITGGTISGCTFDNDDAASIVADSCSGNSATANIVIDASQPNITSVGELISLSVAGDVTAEEFVGNLDGTATTCYYAP